MSNSPVGSSNKPEQSEQSIFTKVRLGAPEKVLWENEDYFAIKDIHPLSPTHLLLIPKVEQATLEDLSIAEKGELLAVAEKVAHHFGITEYRLMINVGRPYQEIFHVHAHIMSETEMKQPG